MAALALTMPMLLIKSPFMLLVIKPNMRSTLTRVLLFFLFLVICVFVSGLLLITEKIEINIPGKTKQRAVIFFNLFYFVIYIEKTRLICHGKMIWYEFNWCHIIENKSIIQYSHFKELFRNALKWMIALADAPVKILLTLICSFAVNYFIWILLHILIILF